MSYIQPKTDFQDGDVLYGNDLNASNEVIKAGVDDNFDRIQGLEAGKQDTLTAGTGIEITEDNVINNTQTSAEWGNIQGDITDQTDLVDALGSKQDVIDSSHKLDYGLLSNTPTIPSKTSDLTNDNNTVIDASYVHTDNNYSDTDKGKLAGIESGAEENIIETIKVDSTVLTPDANKAVNIDLSGKIDEPTTEGTNGQVLTTDGNGGRTWTTVQGGGGTGDYTDLTNKPQINNVTLSGNKSLSDLGINIPTKTSDLNNDSNFVADANYVHIDNNYTSAEKTKLSGIETGAEVNDIDTIKVNGTTQTITSKAVDITVPTKLSDLNNDNNTVTDASYVHTDNNYTNSEKSKLGNIEAGAKDNVINLYTVSATAPTGGTLLSIYYNTTDHKFYEKQLVLDLEWVELPNMTPKYGVIYVTSETKSIYVYDGTTLVSVGGGETLPVGTILEFPTTDSTKVPDGWLFCDGSAVSRTTYADLFALIGTAFGAGDGSTTFNLPNKAGLVSVGIKSNDTDFNVIGKTGGSKYLQAHSHLITNKYGNANTGQGWAALSSYENAYAPYSSDVYTQNAGTGNSGNLQPYEVSNFIIKVKPTRVLASTVVNAYNESTENAYSCDYSNKAFGGKILWTNESPTSNFASQDMNLSSSDYDCYEIIYKLDKSSSQTFSTGKTIKGSGTYLQVATGAQVVQLQDLEISHIQVILN